MFLPIQRPTQPLQASQSPVVLSSCSIDTSIETGVSTLQPRSCCTRHSSQQLLLLLLLVLQKRHTLLLLLLSLLLKTA
jgi:hypothetical protein